MKDVRKEIQRAVDEIQEALDRTLPPDELRELHSEDMADELQEYIAILRQAVQLLTLIAQILSLLGISSVHKN